MAPLRLFEKRPDHPLAERGELERVLAALRTSKPADALQELQHWQGTLRDFDGFACDDRLALVKSLDEAARPLAAKVFAEFCGQMHRRDRSQRKRAQLLEAFWANTGGAYARCVSDNEQGGKRAGEIRAELPVALARSYRGAFLAAKVRAMMYLPAVPKDWLPLYRPFAFAEVAHFATEAVHVYPKEVHSTPRAELSKLLAFCLAAPHELPPEQIELMARILDRFAISFAWAGAPSAQCGYAIDLAAGAPPHAVAVGEAAQPSRRCFGAGPALAKLAELEKLSAKNLLTDELRFGAEFTPTQMVTVLRHLLRYLVAKPPRRGAQRVAVAGKVEIVRGFAAICQRVTAIEVGAGNALKEDLDVAAAKAKGGLQMAAEEVEAAPEFWEVADQSEWGLGCKLPADGGAWAEPGVLCGIRARPKDPWGVAIIRRLDSSTAGAARCGLQILSKKPVSVWLRVLGREGQEVSNWESSSGSFSYDYARAIVLPDAPKVQGRPMLLLAGGKFVPEQICELVMGDNSRHVKLADFL
ncbi:MAG TPA: hypothetical protein VLW85_11270, partial [Myxococcales bacterium]|nr:hypothetical protein [Myxococcales bacterium]